MLSADCRLPLLLERSDESAVVPSTAAAAAAEKVWGLAGAINASAGRNATDTDPSARAPHVAKFAICIFLKDVFNKYGIYTYSSRSI